MKIGPHLIELDEFWKLGIVQMPDSARKKLLWRQIRDMAIAGPQRTFKRALEPRNEEEEVIARIEEADSDGQLTALVSFLHENRDHRFCFWNSMQSTHRSMLECDGSSIVMIIKFSQLLGRDDLIFWLIGSRDFVLSFHDGLVVLSHLP